MVFLYHFDLCRRGRVRMHNSRQLLHIFHTCLQGSGHNQILNSVQYVDYTCLVDKKGKMIHHSRQAHTCLLGMVHTLDFLN